MRKMNKIKLHYEWLSKLMPEGLPVPSSTLISGPGGTGKPLIGFAFVSSWLEQGGSVVFVQLQYPSKDFTAATLRKAYGIRIENYANRIAFIEFDPSIRFIREVSKDVIKANLLKPEVWVHSIENATKVVEKSELGTMVFGSALNLLLFSKTYKDSILEKLKETLEKDKTKTYLFTVSTSAFREKIRILEDTADNLMFTRMEKPMKLYFRIIKMKGVKFLKDEVRVPLSEQVLKDIKEVADATRRRVVPIIREI